MWEGCGNKGRVGGGEGNGRGPTGGEAEGGVKRKLTRLPIDAGVVAGEPRETQDQREVGQRDQVEGNILRVAAMNADAGRIEVGDGGGKTAVDELNWDGAGMGLGLQIVLENEGRVQKVFGSAGVDESRHRDGKLAREEDVYGKGQMARGGEGEALREGEGEWKHAAQPGPYWLGREFPG